MKRLCLSFGATAGMLLAAGVADAASSIRHVPADYPTIQSALNASSFGDEVLVAPGTYLENLSIGEYQDGVSLRSTAGPDVTIIDGGQLGRVIDCRAVGAATEIDGFSIMNGQVDANHSGGGLQLFHADIRLLNCIVRDNVAGTGGGLMVDDSDPQIINNRILDNRAWASGGGIRCDIFSAPVIERNVIIGNHAGHYGGGVSVWAGSMPLIVNNTIVENVGMWGGGGILVAVESHPSLSRNIIAFNSREGILSYAGSSVKMHCNDLWSNSPANYAGSLPDQTGMNDNISADPLFCNPSARDFTIHETSPCAPDNSPTGCGLIGALNSECGVDAVESATWGGIKARHLPEGTLPVAAKTAKDATAEK